MQPLVSTRVSLAWPPAAPFEDTDTLVIQGRTGFFLDLRIFISGPRVGEIDWASAGVKTFLPDSTPENPKAVFDANIDSRRPPPNPSSPSPTDPPLPDEGSFTTLPNGDVLETGSMSNPDADGAVQPYEEVWRRFPVEEDVRVLILASEDGKAFIGRVGRWEVALKDATNSTPFLAWRRDQQEDGWAEIYLVGGEEARWQLPHLPDEVAGGVGDRVELGGRSWVIKENS
ncbi:hypothetical protein BCR35DRAFT_348952 [Leucosporidium creatinivorum]|uniref:Protein HRI1 n=1 Tax=Leucosporidium creatinivorum TaxID=106004 RepID=A0A1Y2G4Y2_9BASI|nr:hypothetical protein BCR35DRAFT_348952 [Leucosporidium creatinivorum]